MLGHSVKQIFTEFGKVYGSYNVFYAAVRRWRKNFHTFSEFVKETIKSGRPETATGKPNVSKVREILESDGRYIDRGIAKAVGISLSRVHFILKHVLKCER